MRQPNHIRAAVINLVASPSLRCDRATANDVMCPCVSVDSSSLCEVGDGSVA